MSKYHITKLTDYQVAEAFGGTLSLIYREKIAELDQDLQPIYSFLETLNLPRYTDFDRWFARKALPKWARDKMDQIEHMNKIKALAKKIKREPDSGRLNIEKARAVNIRQIYPFKGKGTQVSCCLHEDKTPSASIKYNRLHCFSCHANLDAIGLFQKINNCNFREAVEGINRL